MISSGKKITVVIPCYNEGATIGDVVRNALTHVNEVIVVDDTSKDNSGESARAAGAHVIRNDVNRGYDGSIQKGFEEAIRRGADIILTMDADGQHRIEDIEPIVRPILAGEADVTIGQRPRLARLGETVFAMYTRAKFGIRDPLCGLKAYQREVYQAIGHFDTLKSIGTQLMVEAGLRGFRVKPVEIQIKPRSDESRFYVQTLRGNIKILQAMFRVMKLAFNYPYAKTRTT